ncbi:MAG: TonB-dependent receptor plug domain-containing protein [Gammaproteobacteria bacterium]|nr:TonB-dependent receptor plug domain-containing protein [Gammaproteobacteria bacterium]
MLVLVNGKRRHQFSALNLNVAPGAGTVVTDLNSIPSAAIQRIEVLRDGAAAQYGSDAIAGIVNLVLNDTAKGGTLSGTAGSHNAGDGDTYKVSLNQGLALGATEGFVNFTLEAFDFDGTNRSDLYDGPIYPATPANYAQTGPTPAFPYQTANPRQDRGVYPQGAFVIGNYGSNENRTYQGFRQLRAAAVWSDEPLWLRRLLAQGDHGFRLFPRPRGGRQLGPGCLSRRFRPSAAR